MHPPGEDHTADFNDLLKKEHSLLIQEMNSGYCLNEILYNNEGQAVNIKILKINKAFRTQSGKTKIDIEGKTILDLYPNLDRDVIVKLGSLEQNGNLIEFETFSKDDNNYYGIKAYTVAKGIVACIFKNNTKSKFAELEFKKNQIFTQKVLNTAPNLIYIYDLEQKRNIYASTGLNAILGYTTEEFIGMGDEVFDKLLHPDDKDKLAKHLNRFYKANDGDVLEIEIRFKHKNGEYRILKSHESIFLRDNFNKVRQLVGTAVDITELKQKEEELNAAKEKAEESDMLKSAFLANMSHEIRTPMNGLVGFVELLLQDDISDEKKKFYRNVIQDSCQSLLSIINDILDISKIETKQYSVNLEEINLNDFMLETYSLFLNQAKKKDISINLTKGLEDKNSFIRTDSQKLKQILNNLLSNAIKFTHKGEIDLGYGLKEKELEFYVKDTGIGISNECIENIFERFIQADLSHERKYGGTGLGLAIAKGFTELLGGYITCHSVLNQGSTFIFTIPYTPGVRNLDKEELVKACVANDQTIHILVAEDEEINYLYIEEVLSEIGNIKVSHAINGEEAVKYVKENPKLSLILMDIKMPKMNGLEATKIIKKLRPELPVIAQTAYAMTEDEKLARNAGCDSYFSKPIDREKFSSIIKSFI